MVNDPVSGKEIDEGKAAAHREHEGKTYYFCSASCRDKFNASPQAYAQKLPGGYVHKGHGGCC